MTDVELCRHEAVRLRWVGEYDRAKAWDRLAVRIQAAERKLGQSVAPKCRHVCAADA